MIEEEINIPRGSDEGLLSKLYKVHGKHPNFKRPKGKKGRDCFKVIHYAGAVIYTIHNFLEKDKDRIHQDLTNAVVHSNDPFYAEIFKEHGHGSQARPQNTHDTIRRRL